MVFPQRRSHLNRKSVYVFIPASLAAASWSRILTDYATNPLLVFGTVSLEQVVGLCLSRRLRVRIVQQVLDTQQDLLNGDRGLPRLFFVQDRQTDSSGGVDVGVKQRRDEFACESLVCRTFWSSIGN